MDEKIIESKEQKRLSLLLTFAAFALLISNALLDIFRGKRLFALVPVSAALCGAAVVLTIIALISLVRNFKKLTAKKRSIICSVGLFVLCGLEIWMCASAVSELNDRRIAENSAVIFIKDKYGIEAEAEYEKTVTIVNKERELTTVKMTADGKDFTVEIRTKIGDNTRLADDYQIDEIEQAVFDEVNSVYPGGTLHHVEIYGSDFLGDRVVERYFDGTNLDEVMECQHGAIEVDFVDTKFDLEDPLFEKLDEWDIRPYFTSFDTTDHLEEFVAETIVFVYRHDKDYAKYAPYITDRVKFEYGEAGEKGKVVRKSYNNLIEGFSSSDN